MLRHTLMHTSALRYVYEPSTEIAYTWRLHFGRTMPEGVVHYSITDEDIAHQASVEAAAPVKLRAVRALILRLTSFAADVHRSAQAYTTEMLASADFRRRSEVIYPSVLMQAI
jgi:hypothetical protein